MRADCWLRNIAAGGATAASFSLGQIKMCVQTSAKSNWSNQTFERRMFSKTLVRNLTRGTATNPNLGLFYVWRRYRSRRLSDSYFHPLLFPTLCCVTNNSVAVSCKLGPDIETVPAIRCNLRGPLNIVPFPKPETCRKDLPLRIFICFFTRSYRLYTWLYK